MKRRLVFYPTLFKDIVIPPTTKSKVGTLTAFYSHGVGGFDLRPFFVRDFRKMIAEHQLDLIYRQIRVGREKSICICASIAKGGGNNSVTYIVELYNKD